MFPAKHLKYLIPVRDAVLGKTLELRYLKPMVKKNAFKFIYIHPRGDGKTLNIFRLIFWLSNLTLNNG